MTHTLQRLPVFLQRLPVCLLSSWFVDFSDYALEFFGIYAIPSSVHLLVSFLHEVKLSMHRWQVCTLHLQYMYETKNVVSICKVLFVNLVLCWPAVSWGPNPLCNFTLDRVWFFFLWNDVHHFLILELLREQGSRGGGVWLRMTAHLVLSHCDIWSQVRKKKTFEEEQRGNP